MRLRGFLAFFLLVSTLLLLPVFAQNALPSQKSQAPATSQAPAKQPPSQPPDGEFLRNPFAQHDAAQPLTAPKAGDPPRFKIKVMPLKKLRPQQLPDGPLPRRWNDPGIYLQKTAGLGNICGAIVSYNFSHGENPRLQSVTTCTPAGIVQSRRAHDEEKEPPAPRLVQTKN